MAGLFGARRLPNINPQLGIDIAREQGIMPGDQPQVVQMPQMPGMPGKKPGLFGQGGAGRYMVGAIGDALLQNAGMEPIHGPQMQQAQAMANCLAFMRSGMPCPPMIRAGRSMISASRTWPIRRFGGRDRTGSFTASRRRNRKFLAAPSPQAGLFKETAPVTALAGFPADRLDHITMMSESGGDPSAVSPKGARGLMQVMPATASDPGFGIRPSDGTPQDDVRVGREYRAAMERRYGGDLAKMWAAYNAGPGRVDEALRKYGDRWLDAMPAETRNYVAQNLRALGGN